MPLKLILPESVVSSAYARWLVYGENGTGKSSFLATMPKPLLIVSAVGENLAPYMGHGTVDVGGKALPAVTIQLVESWDDISDVFQMLRPGTSPFKSVGFDTLTRIMGFWLEKDTGIKRNPAELGEFLRSGKPKGKVRDWGTWENLGFMSVETVRDYCQLPLHTVFLCQEDTIRPKFEQDVLETIPVLSPASWKGVKDLVHLLGRLYVADKGDGVVDVSDVMGSRSINPKRQEQRMLLLGKHERYYTKGDTRTLGYCVEEPCWDNLSKSLKTA